MATNCQAQNKQNRNPEGDSRRNTLKKTGEKALNAKKNATKVVGRIDEPGGARVKIDKTLAKILDEAEQSIQKQAARLREKNQPVPPAVNQTNPDGNSPIPNPSAGRPIDIYPEIKKKTVSLEPRRSQQLQQLINDLTEEKAREIIQEAREKTAIQIVQDAHKEAEKIRARFLEEAKEKAWCLCG